MEKTKHHFVAQLAKLLTPFEQANEKKLKLIIHVGTPKTGTTSLQAYLHKNQRKLRSRGILFPHNLEKLKNSAAPQHQWIERNLLSKHWSYLLENFINIVSQIKPNTHTIILSSEGIYNSWWDFPDESKDFFGQLHRLFDVEIWVWFREPLAFIESYYKQCIRNPKIANNPCYGKDLSFAEMLEIDWFSQHLNYQGFISDCHDLFGENNVSVFEYKGDVVQETIQLLGLATPYDNPTPRHNNSLNSASIALLRTINRFDMKAKDKDLLMPHLREINAILVGREAEPLIDAESRRRVLKMVSPIKF